MTSSQILQPKVTVFGAHVDDLNHEFYCEALRRALIKILPEDFFSLERVTNASQAERYRHLEEILPLFTASKKGNAEGFPCNMSFYAMSKNRLNLFKFFFEMISRWLLPGRQLNVVLLYAADFCLPEISNEELTMFEVKLRIDNEEDYIEIQRNLPIIESEISLGIKSAFYARRILEIKGVSADEKTAYIQQDLSTLINRFPEHFNYDVLIEMQHVLVICPDEFKAARASRHLSRIIGVHYLFRNALLEAIKHSAKKRHASLKVFDAYVQTPDGRKKVVGIVGGINFVRDQEFFEEKHLIRSIQHYIPTARAVKRSFFAHKRGSEHVSTFYLEIEKENGKPFTLSEIRELRSELPGDLKNKIEHKLHPMLVPRNEEEVMRNILSLSDQLKYLRDLPQVFTSFDEQSHAHLYFTVIVVRVVRPEARSIQDLFKQSNTFLGYIHDQTKHVGFIRKKHPKEATVFRIKLPKELFLRIDHSIDLYKARQAVVAELTRILGGIRDYNGGMISKQNELLSRVRDLLVDMGDYKELLLENFFYSLSPVVMRTLLDPHAFKTLFLMLLNAIKESGECQGVPCLNIYVEPQYVFAMISGEDPAFKDKIHRAVHKLHLTPTEAAHAYVKVQGRFYLGYIYFSTEIQHRDLFCKALQQVC